MLLGVATSWRTIGRGPLARVSAAAEGSPVQGRYAWTLPSRSILVPVITVGLTGGIGSGKSEVARLLAQHGAVVVDYDALARQAVVPGSPGLAAVVAEFGPEVLRDEGSLDRSRLAAMVFANPARRVALEAIVHPYVRWRSAELARAAPPCSVIVHDVPLLLETSRTMDFDVILVVDAAPEVQLARLTGVRGMSAPEALARMANRASRKERLVAADIVVPNDGGLAQLSRRVDRVWKRLLDLDNAAVR